MTPARRRYRRVLTCIECRRLKRKCDKKLPCSQCQKTMRQCVFPPVYSDALLSTTARTGPRKETSGAASQDDNSEHDTSLLLNSGPSPLRMPMIGSPPRVERQKKHRLCLRIGRLSVTEIIGGVWKFDVSNQLGAMLKGSQGGFVPANEQLAAPVVAWFKPQEVIPLERLLCGIPSSQSNSIDALLSSTQQQALLDRFNISVYPLCPVASLDDISVTVPEDPPSHALKLSMLYSAVFSMQMLEAQRLLGRSKESIARRLKTAYEDAFCRLDIFDTPGIKAFQSIVIYLVPQMAAEMSRQHCVFLAAVIRQFQIAGFHRDQPSDGEGLRRVKRHLWQQLLFLSLRATEAVGPETALIDDPGASMPLVDMEQHSVYAAGRWADSIIAIVRYECNKIHRMIFVEGEALQGAGATFDDLTRAVEDRISFVYQTYLQKLDTSVTSHKYASTVANALLHRARLMINSRRRRECKTDLAKQENDQRCIQSSIALMEAAVALDTDPELSHLAWYAGAYQQYHSLLVPLGQVCQRQDLPEVDVERIMAVASHVFGPSSAPNQIRSAMILRKIKESLEKLETLVTADSTSSTAQHNTHGNEEDTTRRTSLQFPWAVENASLLGIGLAGGGGSTSQETEQAEQADLADFDPGQMGVDMWWTWQPFRSERDHSQ